MSTPASTTFLKYLGPQCADLKVTRPLTFVKPPGVDWPMPTAEVGYRSLYQFSAYKKAAEFKERRQGNALTQSNDRLKAQEGKSRLLQTQVDDLEGQLRDKSTQLATAKDTIDKMHAQHDVQEASMAALRATIQRLEGQLKSIDDERIAAVSLRDLASLETERLYMEILDVQGKLFDTEASRDEFQRQAMELTNDSLVLCARAAELEAAQASLLLELASLTQALEVEKAAHDVTRAECESLKQDKSQLTSDLARTSIEVVTLRHELQAVEAKLEEQAAEYMLNQLALETQKVELTLQLTEKDEEINVLAEAVKDLKAQISDVRADTVAAAETSLEEASLDVSRLALEIEHDLLSEANRELRTELEAKDTALLAAVQEKKGLEAKLAAALAACVVATTSLVVPEDSLVVDDNEVSDASLDVSRFALEIEHDMLSDDVEGLRAELQAKYNDVLAAQARVTQEVQAREDLEAKLAAALAELDKRNETIQAQALHTASLMKDLQEERVAHQLTRDDSDERISLVTAENDALRVDLTETKKANVELTSELKRACTAIQRCEEDLREMGRSCEEERQAKVDVQEQASVIMDELNKENSCLEKSKKAVEKALKAKVMRCDALERENSSLREEVVIVKDGGYSLASIHHFDLDLPSTRGVSSSTPSGPMKENEFADPFVIGGPADFDTPLRRSPRMTSTPLGSASSANRPTSANFVDRFFRRSVSKYFNGNRSTEVDYNNFTFEEILEHHAVDFPSSPADA
ncbi:hypothetical protein K474DRAFT_1768565 [Panus rudis PR-1116 ss-1]|nr:hypothetical protein K474DRAFT_1768565 [Panus rudis PR-1116 ss-1]